MVSERQEGRQLTLRGFHESQSRLRRARRANKSLTGDEKSVVLEEVWSEGLEMAFRRLAQGWADNNHSFSFRVSDGRAGVYASATEVGEAVFDAQSIFQNEIKKAHKRRLPAITVIRRLIKDRSRLAQELNDDTGWTRDVVSQAIELTGAVYGLQPSTIKDYQRFANFRARRVDSRLR
jgi:hypothetical protein